MADPRAPRPASASPASRAPNRGPDPRRVAAIVLAAGAGRRFGGQKLAAELDGRPVLRHVLERLAEAGLAAPFVVVPPDRGPLKRAIGPPQAARVIVNPAPACGLASSLKVGWAAALGSGGPVAAVIVALGDQPWLRADVVRRLLAAPLDPERPIVAPRYAAGGGPNPLRIEPSAGRLVEATVGDRGLGPLLEQHPELVRWIEVDGANPDVDRPSDLERSRDLEPRPDLHPRGTP